MKIRTHLQLGVTSAVVLAVGVWLFLLWSTQQVNKTINENNIADKVVWSIFELNIVNAENISLPNERTKTQLQLLHGSLADLLLVAETKFTHPSEQRIIQQLRKNQENVKYVFLQLLAAEKEHEADLKDVFASQIFQKSHMMVSAASRLAARSHIKVASAERRVRLLLFVFAGLVGTVIVGASFWAGRRILRPITQFHKGTEIIGAGNLNHKIGINSQDEIGQLARAFDRMTEKLKKTTVSRDELSKEVTMRKEAQEALSQSEEQYALAQRAANIGSWNLDILTGGLCWSDRVEPLFGFGPGEFGATYEAFLKCVHPENRQHVIDSVKACVEEGEDYAIEHRIVWPDGTVRWVAETGDVFRDESGKAIRMFGVVQDVTERKRAEDELEIYRGHLEELVKERTAELEEANKKLAEEISEHEKTEEALFRARGVAEEATRAKSEFLANMSHELRTPLNAVIGFSELLEDQLCGPLNEKQQGHIENILTSGQHLLALITDILDLSKVESGKMELELGRFPLRGVLDSSLVLLREKAHKHNINLGLEVEPEADVEIEADQRKCRQILFNLLSNALKFTPDGGSVAVQARKIPATEAQAGGDWVEISVADTGIGIKSEDMPKLFKVFSQLESPLTKQYEGTGLGLVLTRKFVELHGGRIWAESEFGKGSRFSFALPLRPPAGKTG